MLHEMLLTALQSSVLEGQLYGPHTDLNNLLRGADP